MKLSTTERVTAQQYVDELMRAMQEVYGSVQKAQERRAEETRERAGRGRVPKPLEVGQLVLLRRPPAVARDDQDHERSVSRKLQPKARVELYREAGIKMQGWPGRWVELYVDSCYFF